MNRNDYRRALIMLRPNASGYSGHARLERRTLTGTMYLTLTTPDQQAELCAALVRRNPNGSYQASAMGALKRDARGQAVLAYSFDPRNIDGYTLEDYWLLVIVKIDGNGCDIALTGNVNGSHEVDWGLVRTAACGVCSRGPACDLYAAPSGTTGQKTVEPAASPPVIAEEPAMPELAEFEDAPIEMEAQPMETEELPVEAESAAPITTAAPTQGPTAAELLGIDMSIPWPSAAEPLREYFATRCVSELMLNNGYIFVRVPMPEGSGYPHCEAGIRISNGVPDSVCYALPSRYSVEPPAGLEDYTWAGGAAEGWWMICTDAVTGMPIE